MGTERLLYSPDDGGHVMRVSLPKLASQLVGSYDGGWVASFHDHEGRRQFAIVNLFSGSEVTLSRKQTRFSFHIRKLVFSETPTSSGCVLAAITHQWHVALCCGIGCAKLGRVGDGVM